MKASEMIAEARLASELWQLHRRSERRAAGAVKLKLPLSKKKFR